MKTGLLHRIMYLMILLLLSGLVLVSFLRPTRQHMGINQYDRVQFLDVVEGKAHRPFVYRTLLPTTVRIVSRAVPESYHRACADLVEQRDLARKAFSLFRWESRAALQYLLASVLMLLSFMGFAHFAAKLTERLCDVPATTGARLLLVMGALAGLPAFFRYVSYVYDPAQLFLFTLALYLLAAHRIWPFCLAFVACCLNKETAVLLIPLFALEFHDRSPSRRRYWFSVAGLIVVYVGIKSALTWYFRGNPGSFVEFHLAHNLQWLTSGWNFTDLLVFLGLSALVVYRWRDKSAFLRRSLLCVLPPLVSLALFLGFIDEWRGYYEAYPIIYAMLVDSLLRLRASLRPAGI